MPPSPHNMSSEHAIAKFLAKYSPEVASGLQTTRVHVAALFPRGFELVYDNYNALVFGFFPTERSTDTVVSVVGYPRWVTLFFLKGTALPDPSRILQGTGSMVRSVRLLPLSVLHQPAVQTLLAATIEQYASVFEQAPRLSTIVKSVSVKQRSRQPSKTLARKGKTRGSGA